MEEKLRMYSDQDLYTIAYELNNNSTHADDSLVRKICIDLFKHDGGVQMIGLGIPLSFELAKRLVKSHE
jgi:hypothetical protein